jgi:hypothetical protein
MRTLAANRKPAPVPETAVGAHLHEPLDVHGEFLAEIALYGAFLFEDGTDAIGLLFREVRDFLVGVDTGPVAKRKRPGPPDAVDISQADFDPLLIWKINTC